MTCKNAVLAALWRSLKPKREQGSGGHERRHEADAGPGEPAVAVKSQVGHKSATIIFENIGARKDMCSCDSLCAAPGKAVRAAVSRIREWVLSETQCLTCVAAQDKKADKHGKKGG